jgi:hypothetical protein
MKCDISNDVANGIDVSICIQAQALADAFGQQAEQLAFVAQNLPSRLPACQPAVPSAAAQTDKVLMLLFKTHTAHAWVHSYAAGASLVRVRAPADWDSGQ